MGRWLKREVDPPEMVLEIVKNGLKVPGGKNHISGRLIEFPAAIEERRLGK